MQSLHLATQLNALATGALSDAVTRAANGRRLAVTPLRVRIPVRTVRRRRFGSSRVVSTGESTVTGMNGYLLDLGMAIALARGGIFLRDETAEVFVPVDERTLAATFTSSELQSYVDRAHRLIASERDVSASRPTTAPPSSDVAHPRPDDVTRER